MTAVRLVGNDQPSPRTRVLVGLVIAGFVILVLAGCKDREPYSNGIAGTSDSSSDKKSVAGSKSLLVFDHSADLCEDLPTHSERVAIKRVAKPPYLKRYLDPAFGSTVVRITDSDPGTVHKPLYSTIQAWNADETLIMLYRAGKAGAAHVLLDGITYEPVGRLDIAPTDIEEVFWSHLEADILYYVSTAKDSAGDLLEMNVRDGTTRVLDNFKSLCGDSSIRSGNDVMMQALDDDLFGFRCETKGNDYSGDVMFTYRVSTRELVVAELKAPWNATTAARPTPSGKYIYQQGSVLELDLVREKSRIDVFDYETHGNLGRTRAGDDALYLTTFDPSPNGCDGDLWKGVGHLVEFNLEKGTCKSLVGEGRGWPYTTSGTHVSAVAYQRPGWIAMSSIGYGKFEYFDGEMRPPALMSEVYLVDAPADSKPRVCRLAQHRSYGKSSKTEDYPPYFGEPHATISPSGTRILFGSDWYDSGSVDAYVIELPAYKNARNNSSP